jgi:hypothetical protein
LLQGRVNLAQEIPWQELRGVLCCRLLRKVSSFIGLDPI